MKSTLVQIIGTALISASLVANPSVSFANHGDYNCQQDAGAHAQQLNEIDKFWDHQKKPMPWLVWLHSDASSEYINCVKQRIESETGGKYTFRKVGEKGDKRYYGFIKDKRLDQYFEIAKPSLE